MPEWSNYILTALCGMFKKDDWVSPDSGTIKSMDKAMTSMAHALTNYVRVSMCADASAPGTQFSGQPYLHVRWIWLAPTVAVLVLCLVFFVAVVIQSWGETLWKSSVFAYIVTQPRAGGEELSAQQILKLAQAKAGSEAHTVASLVQRTCEKIEVDCDTATIRFRARDGDTLKGDIGSP